LTALIQAPPEKIRRLRELQARKAELLKQQRRREAPQWDTPGQLAAAIDPATVQTPALALIDDALVWAYTTPGARLLVSMPPQEGKTTRVSKIGALWALTRDPDRRLGIASYAQSLAEGFGREIRNTITTFDGTEDTLDIGLRIAPDYGSAKRWQLDGHRGGVVTVGIGSGLTGRALEALTIDDPFADAEQAGSAYYRDRVWDWWQSVGAPRLAPGAPAIVVLTRWHEDDLAGRMVAAEDGHRWRVINIPALADHKPEKGQTDPLGREPGEWLQSARRRTVAEWEQIRIQAGSRVFAALYQGRPSPDAGNVWQRQWWRRYYEPLWSQHPDVPGAYTVRDMDEMVMSWDMAFKDTRSSDFVVGQVWGRRGADVFLLDQVHKRLSFTDTLVAFAAMVARWPQATRKLVEDKANGTAVISTLKSKIPGLVAINPTDSKYGRATAVAPFIEAGNVFLPAPDIALFDTEAFIDEAAAFNNGAHDDQVDATSQALAEMLLDGNGAAAWIAWAKRKAEEAAGGALPDPAASPVAETLTLQPSAVRPPVRYSAAQLAEARALIASGGLVPTGKPGEYHARSSDRRTAYLVTADSCQCPAGQYGTPCKHRAAVAIKDAPGPEAGVVLSPAELRKNARDAAYRAQRNGGW
jgi:predicted phage terminase large subunit-like protein